ncbi:MAG: glycosyltransferase family 2 protein, partial [Candidatus Promineifilaceae bacterium]
MSILQLLLAFLLILWTLYVLYYYILLIASAIKVREQEPPEGANQKLRFALLVPAHNEEMVIGKTVRKMKKLNYDKDLFDVVVIADNCSDRTEEMAKEAGAVSLLRNSEPSGRKGFAIEWYFDEVLPLNHSYDAIIIFDADSQPDPNFLLTMSSHLRLGQSVLQGRHVISNPEDSAFTRLADIDMRTNNRLRNFAKRNLGLSCRLMGDAMCFERSVLERYEWGAESLVEDREYGIQLVSEGVEIAFVPEAESRGQAAAGWAQGKSQRLRWVGGVNNLRRKYGFDLLSTGLRNRNWSAIDQSLELLSPPFSLMIAGAVFLLLVQLLYSPIGFNGSMWITAAIAAGLFLVPVIGL